MRKKAWVHQRGSRWLAKLVMSAALTALALTSRPALAQTFNSGSTGADGAFNPTTNTTLTLPPDGVFNFTTINIPAGVTVTFTRNAANTPVTMLASGNVTIAGTISLNGDNGGNAVTGTNVAPNGGTGGAGGFNGGDGADGMTSTTGGAGLGPGGGSGGTGTGQYNASSGGGGGFAWTGGSSSGGSGSNAGGSAYGTTTLLPLIGGSGGGGGGGTFGNTAAGGGGGGGALLIASSGTISFSGVLSAVGGAGGGSNTCGQGGGGGGSGGAVRLVATTITGSGGSININGASYTYTGCSGNSGTGAAGRIRIEAYTNTSTINYTQAPSIDKPGALALPGSPSLTITAVAGVSAPAAPTGSFATPDITVPATTANPMTIALAAVNIPLGTTVTVTVKPLDGAASSATSTALAGTLAASTATASLTIPTNQPSVISASATFTLAAVPGVGPIFARGEAIEQVRVAAGLGGPSRVVYVTRSGREIAPE